MVKYDYNLDLIFASLSDPTRRDILKRVSAQPLSVSEIASPYHMSIPAISKHLRVLEDAKLINKMRQGKQQFVSLSPPALKVADEYLQKYKEMWEERFDQLDEVLKKLQTKNKKYGKK